MGSVLIIVAWTVSWCDYVEDNIGDPCRFVANIKSPPQKWWLYAKRCPIVCFLFLFRLFVRLLPEMHTTHGGGGLLHRLLGLHLFRDISWPVFPRVPCGFDGIPQMTGCNLGGLLVLEQCFLK